MQTSDLRIALFSGNYNMTIDGANKALNRLVEYVLRQGAAVRVYSPTIENPPLPPKGDLVSLPSVAIPGRSEYRFPLGLNDDVRRDLAEFAPNVVHLSSPDPSAHAALKWARARDLPVLGSVHTRFESYPQYYHLGFMEPVVVAILRRFYSRCDALVAPNAKAIEELRAQGMNDDISLWSRGVDRTIFTSDARDMDWRRAIGLADDDVAIVFLGRLVMEKGLDAFAETAAELRKRGIKHKVLVIGDGPARGWFEGNAGGDIRWLSGRQRSGPRDCQRRYLLQPLHHRDFRQCHTGSDGLRPACRRRRRNRRDRSGNRRRDGPPRAARPGQKLRPGLRRCARRILHQ